MKKLLLGTLLWALTLALPHLTMAQVNVGINISLPPLIVFAAPPELVVIPETYVYVVPDVEMEIFFYNGWWYRPWEDQWYRSRHYDSGWHHYQKVPSFYREIPSSWRDDYREQRWRGHAWDNRRLPQKEVKQNWRSWEKNKHWEKENTWGVKDLQPKRDSSQQHQEVQSQPKEVAHPQQAEPQKREAPHQSKSQHEKSGRDKEDKKDRR